MCGRYYVDHDTGEEIAAVIEAVSQKMGRRPSSMRDGIPAFACGDVHPADPAPVILRTQHTVACSVQRWGLPGYSDGKKPGRGAVIFNARAESVLEKPSFRDAVRDRRIVVPAAQFYEWNRLKEKNTFRRIEHRTLFLAGCYNWYEDGARFTIITTKANDSMRPVHDRMPLILEKEEIAAWLLDDRRAEAYLKKVPCTLERRTEYEQLSLF